MSKSKKPAAPPVVLVVDSVKREASSGIGPQIHVYPATIEHADNGRRVIRHPETIAGIHCNHGQLAWRWYRHDPHDSLVRSGPRPLSDSFTHGPRYRNVYLVDLNDAEAMAKSLRLVEKRLAALREKFGAADSFAEYILRVASIFDAAEVAIDWNLYTEATGNKRGQWVADDPADQTYKIMAVGDARAALAEIDRVDTTARCRECKRPVEDGATHCYDHKEPLEQVAADAVEHEVH